MAVWMHEKGKPGWLAQLPNLDDGPDTDDHWMIYWEVPDRTQPATMNDWLQNGHEKREPPSTASSGSQTALPVNDWETMRQRRKQRAQQLYHGWSQYSDDKLKALL